MNDNKKRIFGIIGKPLTHSFSPVYFNQKFESENINAEYLKFELPDIGDLMEVVSEYPNLSGLNVTIPYKQQVIPYLDDIDEDAKKIGAVNVIKITRGKGKDLKFKGYNSDCPAFANSLRPLLTSDCNKALILGTGGAAKAVYQGLVNLGIEPTYVSRASKENAITYKDLNEGIISSHNIIVNCTPVGMYPHEDQCPPIPYELLTPKHICYDLIYNPDTTLFMKKANSNGATVKNGLEMLLLQAFESWQIWNS